MKGVPPATDNEPPPPFVSQTMNAPDDPSSENEAEAVSPDLEAGSSEPQSNSDGNSEGMVTAAETLTQETPDESFKFAQHNHIVTVEAVPIISVEIDGPHEASLHDEIITQEHFGPDDDAYPEEPPSFETMHPMATAVPMLQPLSIEQTQDSMLQEAARDYSDSAAETIKSLKRRNHLLVAVAVLLLVIVSIGIGVVIGKDSDSDDNKNRPAKPACEDELDLLNFCLIANPVNSTRACQRCVEDTAPLYDEPEFCVSPYYNGTDICQRIESCADSRVCASSCLRRMVRYMQCRLVGTRRFADLSESLYDNENMTTNNSLVDACLLPCGQ